MQEDTYFENEFEGHDDLPEFLEPPACADEDAIFETPANASDTAQFWEEFKQTTRSYPGTDEVALLIRSCSRSQVMEHMFHYLCACCAFSASADTMFQSQLHEHYSMVAMTIVKTMPTKQGNFDSSLFLVLF